MISKAKFEGKTIYCSFKKSCGWRDSSRVCSRAAGACNHQSLTTKIKGVPKKGEEDTMELTRELQEKLLVLVTNHLRIIDNEGALRYRSMDEILELNADIADFRTIKRFMTAELGHKTKVEMLEEGKDALLTGITKEHYESLLADAKKNEYRLGNKIMEADIRLGDFDIMHAATKSMLEDLNKDDTSRYPKNIVDLIEDTKRRSERALENLDKLVAILIEEHIL